MDAIAFLKDRIMAAIPDKFGSVSELAEKAGVNQPNLSELMKGNRKSLKLETAWKIMQALDIKFVEGDATIRRIEDNAPVVSATGEGMVPIDVFAVAGAGPAWSIQESEPVYSITAPPAFAQQLTFALLVDGESMYPTIKNGSVVGITNDSHFRQNEIFAVSIPYEGMAIKRVAIDHETGHYVLRSDNPDKEKYNDVRISIEEAPHLLVGRVVWVWQPV